MTTLEQLKLRVGVAEDSSDSRLEELLASAKEYICAYCRMDGYDESLDSLAVRIAAEDFCRLSSEGISYRSFSGAYESYRDGYSEAVMATLRAHRKLKAL